jgi:hypothetical protein
MDTERSFEDRMRSVEKIGFRSSMVVSLALTAGLMALVGNPAQYGIDNAVAILAFGGVGALILTLIGGFVLDQHIGAVNSMAVPQAMFASMLTMCVPGAMVFVVAKHAGPIVPVLFGTLIGHGFAVMMMYGYPRRASILESLPFAFALSVMIQIWLSYFS